MRHELSGLLKIFNPTCQRTRTASAGPNELRFSGLFQQPSSCTFWITSPRLWTDYRLEDDDNNNRENKQQEYFWPHFLCAWTFTDVNMLSHSESPCKHCVVSSIPEKYWHLELFFMIFLHFTDNPKTNSSSWMVVHQSFHEISALSFRNYQLLLVPKRSAIFM